MTHAMNVQQLTEYLVGNTQSSLRFILPSGERIPDHFHITEVGRVEKDFIDCGGTRRKSISCLLQAWTANDIDHRLLAGNLASILKIAAPILGSTVLPVEVEYGPGVAVQYQLAEIQVGERVLHLVLVGKQTDCLAKDRCGADECSTSGCCS
jgi:hypothetical protein